MNSEDESLTDPYFRFMNDYWYFGILLTTGKILVIEHIDSVYDEYIKVSMRTQTEAVHIADIRGRDPKDFIGSFCERESAIVRKENIVMIFELADT